MPRFIQRKQRLTSKQRAERANKYRVTRSFVWQDPFPEVPGTVPEKIVYAGLMRRGIPFIFQSDLHIVLPDYDLEGNDWYKPDFVLPAEKIIIEVQGAYWHTKADQIDKDSYKYALYQLMGYKVLLWWDYDIEANIDNLFSAEPLLFWRRSPEAPIPKIITRSDQQEYADGKSKNGARISRRKPWTKPAVSFKIRKVKATRKPRKGRT